MENRFEKKGDKSSKFCQYHESGSNSYSNTQVVKGNHTKKHIHTCTNSLTRTQKFIHTNTHRGISTHTQKYIRNVYEFQKM